jgi:hypothetical protein
LSSLINEDYFVKRFEEKIASELKGDFGVAVSLAGSILDIIIEY